MHFGHLAAELVLPVMIVRGCTALALPLEIDDLPFGGVGASGMGHYHGRWGFDTFSKLTPVFRQSRLNGTKLFLPPYRPHVERMLRLMKRF